MRHAGGRLSVDPIATRCAISVAAHDPSERIIRGAFSRISFHKPCFLKRSNGQKSNSSKTIGVVTNIGFDIKPKAKQAATTAIRCQVEPRTYLAYASKVSMKKAPLRRSFRSEIQATDSTRSG